MSNVNHPTYLNPTDVAWYFVQGDAEVGPVSEAALLEAAEAGRLTPDTLVWQLEFDSWTEAANVPLFTKSSVFLAAIERSASNGLPPRSGRGGRISAEKPLAADPVQESSPPSAEEQQPLQELSDALSDDELVEPIVDTKYAHEVLKRTSYYPAERTIPPASYSTPPIAVAPFSGKVTAVPRLYAYASAGVLSVTCATLFLLRGHAHEQPRDDVFEPALQDTRASSTVTNPSVEPEEAVAPRTTANWDVPLLENDIVIESGSVDAQLIRAKLDHARFVFDKQCWSRYHVPGLDAPKNPSIQVTMSLDRFGNVYDVESTKTSVGYRGAELCIIGRIRGWKFPRTEQGARAVITVSRVKP